MIASNTEGMSKPKTLIMKHMNQVMQLSEDSPSTLEHT